MDARCISIINHADALCYAVRGLSSLFLIFFVSVAVAVFLFISGFGINESHKINGINNFWKKRFLRVIIPCWTIFLFQLPFVEHFNSVQLLKNLTFYASDLWFVDYIIRWYLVYWISRRFLGHLQKRVDSIAQ